MKKIILIIAFAVYSGFCYSQYELTGSDIKEHNGKKTWNLDFGGENTKEALSLGIRKTLTPYFKGTNPVSKEINARFNLTKFKNVSNEPETFMVKGDLRKYSYLYKKKFNLDFRAYPSFEFTVIDNKVMVFLKDLEVEYSAPPYGSKYKSIELIAPKKKDKQTFYLYDNEGVPTKDSDLHLYLNDMLNTFFKSLIKGYQTNKDYYRILSLGKPFRVYDNELYQGKRYWDTVTRFNDLSPKEENEYLVSNNQVVGEVYRFNQSDGIIGRIIYKDTARQFAIKYYLKDNERYEQFGDQYFRSKKTKWRERRCANDVKKLGDTLYACPNNYNTYTFRRSDLRAYKRNYWIDAITEYYYDNGVRHSVQYTMYPTLKKYERLVFEYNSQGNFSKIKGHRYAGCDIIYGKTPFSEDQLVKYDLGNPKYLDEFVGEYTKVDEIYDLEFRRLTKKLYYDTKGSIVRITYFDPNGKITDDVHFNLTNGSRYALKYFPNGIIADERYMKSSEIYKSRLTGTSTIKGENYNYSFNEEEEMFYRNMILKDYSTYDDANQKMVKKDVLAQIVSDKNYDSVTKKVKLNIRKRLIDRKPIMERDFIKREKKFYYPSGKIWFHTMYRKDINKYDIVIYNPKGEKAISATKGAGHSAEYSKFEVHDKNVLDKSKLHPYLEYRYKKYFKEKYEDSNINLMDYYIHIISNNGDYFW